MADIVLYEEIPRPYASPPQMVDRMVVETMSVNAKGKLRSEVVDMFGVLQLVLDPLAAQMPHLRRHISMDDLLRKLHWYTVLFKQIIKIDVFTAEDKSAFKNFDKQVDKLLRKRDLAKEDFDSGSGKIPEKPIDEGLVATSA
ncbi:MAG: hypothetical protein Q9170_003630 [Blastenia crenularia]